MCGLCRAMDKLWFSNKPVVFTPWKRIRGVPRYFESVSIRTHYTSVLTMWMSVRRSGHITFRQRVNVPCLKAGARFSLHPKNMEMFETFRTPRGLMSVSPPGLPMENGFLTFQMRVENMI